MKFSCSALNHCGQKRKNSLIDFIIRSEKKVTMRAALIRNDPVYPPGEWLRGHRVTQVRVRHPPSPRTAPLLSADGAEEEGVTKARALGVIRKGHVSRFGPGSYPGRPLREAIQGPGGWAQPGKPPRRCSHMQVWICPCAVRYTECRCVFTCGSFGAVKEREEERERQTQRVRWSSGQESHTAGKPNCFRI